jgi:hypothetical protein
MVLNRAGYTAKKTGFKLRNHEHFFWHFVFTAYPQNSSWSPAAPRRSRGALKLRALAQYQGRIKTVSRPQNRAGSLDLKAKVGRRTLPLFQP